MHRIIEEIVNSARLRSSARQRKKIEPGRQERDFIAQLQKAKALGRVPVIAEVKPASPLGEKRVISSAQAAAIAREMESAGAVAISVLTEPEHFKGSLENLEAVRSSVALPVLRKDFVVSEAQIFEAKADLILLIAGILGEELKHFAELSIKLGMEPLVEVHDEADIKRALDIDARVIGINNRDFKTLSIDLRRTEKLAPLLKRKDEEVIVISESGIRDAKDAKRVISAGADGILVGSAIMSSANIRAKTLELVNVLEAKR